MTLENHSSSNNKESIWYTYFGIGGAGAFAFLWIILLLTWIFSVLTWG